MPENEKPLTPADPDELAYAIAHALRFDGRKAFRTSGEMMAKITASHLIACLERSGFVVMKGPPRPAHSDTGHHEAAKRNAAEKSALSE
jgi:hypothetical protein